MSSKKIPILKIGWEDLSGSSPKKRSKKTRSKRSIVFKYKGKPLTPLTPEEALSLDKGDTLKYIGTAGGGKVTDSSRPSWSYGTVYGNVRRRPLVLRDRPVLSGNNIQIPFWGRKITCPITDWALLSRGDKHSIEVNRALRFVPMALNRFKIETETLSIRARKKIDKYLNDLPLHKKLEVFRALTPEQKTILDALDEDIAALLGLKETVQSEQKET